MSVIEMQASVASDREAVKTERLSALVGLLADVDFSEARVHVAASRRDGSREPTSVVAEALVRLRRARSSKPPVPPTT